MAGPRARKGPRSEATAKLLEALAAIRHCQDKDGSVYEQHCRIANGWVTAYNGKLAIGVKVDESFEANPNTEQLTLALKKTGETVSFTQMTNQQLVIESGKFTAYVPTVDKQYLPGIVPDLPVAKINNKLLDALTICSVVVDEKLDVPLFTGVCIDGKSCAATDRHSIFEFWHGIHLPTGLIIPKASIKALGERGLELTDFGFSDRTATFYYSDGSYLQTALLFGKFPDYQTILNDKSNQQAIPADFFSALSSILDFSDDGTIYFGAGELMTNDRGAKGAKYQVPGITEGRVFNGKRLAAIEKYAKSCDFYHPKGAMFLGDCIRGIVARRV